MSRRRTHFAVERLSKEGQAVVRRGHSENWTLEQAAEELQKTTGETIATSSLHRWWQNETVRQKCEKRQQNADAALAMVRSDPDGRMARNISLMVQEHLLLREEELVQGDAHELLSLHLAMEKMANVTKRTEIAEREVGAYELEAQAKMVAARAAQKPAEAKLESIRQAAQKLAEKLEQAEKQVSSGGRSLTVEELRRIREEVFGFASEPELEVAHG